MAYRVEEIPDAARAGAALQQWLNDEADQMMTLITLDISNGIAVFESLENPSPI